MGTQRASLADRLARLGQQLARREAEHRLALEQAWKRAEELHAELAGALSAYAEAIADAPQLAVELGPVRSDEKHVRSVEFELRHGRTRGLFVVKSRGELTLVGPFRTGKTEGPCQRLSWEAEEERAEAVARFVERFLEEAATP